MADGLKRTMSKFKRLNEPEQERFPFEKWTAVFPLGKRWVGCLNQRNGIVKAVCGHLHRSEERAEQCARRKFPESRCDERGV
jgi:hypothetical protein